MAGIYIHIPFCRQKCAYCDFHFSTDSSYAGRMVNAICSEASSRKEELQEKDISTVYFGGGTPSVLSHAHLTKILQELRANYSLSEDLELTLEANPEDVNESVVEEFMGLGVNRLSMGIQSFDDQVLQSMNRSHDATQALHAVVTAQQAGITNISVDIIYGLPGKSLDDFKRDLAQFVELNVPHISAYALTIEKGTLFHHKVEKGTMTMPDDELVEEQFYTLRETLASAGLEQYEVSNFAKKGFISQHNSAYWQGVPYVGIGPSAHSYDGRQRAWNIANNHRYMQAIEGGQSCQEVESLDKATRYNEYVLTRLRTKWGLDLAYIQREFDVDILHQFEDVWERHRERFTILDGHLVLATEGLILADGIASDLFQIT